MFFGYSIIVYPCQVKIPGPGGAGGGYCDIVLHKPLIVVKCIFDAITMVSKNVFIVVAGKIGIGFSNQTPGFVTVLETTDRFNIVPGAGISGGIFPNSTPIQYEIIALPYRASDWL
jgi:hypothetical protein